MNLAKAIAIAANAHVDQTDKRGAAYILHPLAVMRIVADWECGTEAHLIVAVLHDVIEDTDVTADALIAAGFSNEIVTMVEVLTRRAAERYEDYILRVKRYPMAAEVKLADLEHNLDPRRAANVPPEQLSKYRKAVRELCGQVAEAERNGGRG